MSDWPVVPSSTSWCATSPRRRTEWTWMSPGPSPPRAPGATSIFVGSAAHVGRRRRPCAATVIIAVPDGASIFWSWCSSMISAVSNNGAASSAKRIMSTAPMAKLGATMQLLRGEQMAQLVELVVAETRRADDRVHLVHRAPAQVAHRRLGHGEVDGHLGAARRPSPAALAAIATPAAAGCPS